MSCCFEVSVQNRFTPSLLASVVHKQNFGRKHVAYPNSKLDGGNVNGEIKVTSSWVVFIIIVIYH